MIYVCQILISIQSVFESATAEAEKVNVLTFRFIIAGSFIFLLVAGLLVYVSVKFRAKAADREPMQVRRHKKVEVAMIGIPFLKVAFFFYLSIKTMEATEPPVHNQKPDIIIVGHQWWWEVRYPEGNVLRQTKFIFLFKKKYCFNWVLPMLFMTGGCLLWPEDGHGPGSQKLSVALYQKSGNL